jgi:hypothetical protein
MKGGAHAQLNTSQPEEVTPKVACEDRVSIAHDRLWKTVQADNVGEERTGDGGGRVRMPPME